MAPDPYADVALALWTAETVASLAAAEDAESFALEEEAACRYIAAAWLRRLEAAGLPIPRRTSFMVDAK